MEKKYYYINQEKKNISINELTECNYIDDDIMLEYKKLNWYNSRIYYPGMVVIRTEGDGSCFFHAISKAISYEYKNGVFDNYLFDKKGFIRELRSQLADELDNYYNKLSRGKLPELSKSLPELRLENMKSELASNLPVDNKYNEYISDILNIDLYLLDGNKKDLYITGKDSDILYKNRKSIVILYKNYHYELIGLIEYDYVNTIFEPDHPFILKLKSFL